MANVNTTNNSVFYTDHPVSLGKLVPPHPKDFLSKLKYISIHSYSKH